MANHISASAAQSALSIQELVTTMKTAGMADTAIRQTLLNDLNTGGPLFGSFRNKLKNTVKNGVEASSNGSANGKFTKAGVSQFQWVSVGDGKVCPDCEERHGETGTMEYFETIGLPASGFSVCTTNCRCQLLPENYKGENLDKPLVKEKIKTSPNVTNINMAGKHKTVKDSFKWMEKNGVVNNGFKNLPMDYANTITDALSRLPAAVRKNIVLGDFAHFQKADGLKFKSASGHNYGVSKQLQGFDSRSSKIDALSPSFKDMKRSTLSPLHPDYKPLTDYNLIGFNTRQYKTLDEISKRKESRNNSYYKNKGKNYNFNTSGEATVHHEFGHLVQEHLTRNQRSEWDELAKKWIKKDSTEYLKVRQAFTEFYSEAFAEAWGAYQTNQKSRLPDYIIEFIDNI